MTERRSKKEANNTRLGRPYRARLEQQVDHLSLSLFLSFSVFSSFIFSLIFICVCTWSCCCCCRGSTYLFASSHTATTLFFLSLLSLFSSLFSFSLYLKSFPKCTRCTSVWRCWIWNHQHGIAKSRRGIASYRFEMKTVQWLINLPLKFKVELKWWQV